MSKTQEFTLKLERRTLEDAFELVEQELPIDIVVPASLFQKASCKIHQCCKDEELFVVKAFCRIESSLLVRPRRSTELSFRLTIEHLTDFKGAIISDEPMIIR